LEDKEGYLELVRKRTERRYESYGSYLEKTQAGKRRVIGKVVSDIVSLDRMVGQGRLYEAGALFCYVGKGKREERDIAT
jgi:hypothetical protein